MAAAIPSFGGLLLLRSQIRRCCCCFSTTVSVRKYPAFTTPTPTPTTPASLPHLTATSTVHVVPVSHKPITARSALAVGQVAFSTPHPLVLIRAHALQKGDVLAVASVAAITAAKKTSDWIPLCHSGVPIEGIKVRVEVVDGQQDDGKEEAPATLSPTFPSPSLVAKQAQSESEPESLSRIRRPSASPSPTKERQVADNANEDNYEGEAQAEKLERSWFATPLPPFGGVRILVRVDTTAKTGIEMEALVGVVGAGLTVVDMCKAVDRGLVLEGVKVVGKKGGRSGSWGVWEGEGERERERERK